MIALLIALFVQDAGWGMPVELDKGKMVIPWSLAVEGDAATLVLLRAEDEKGRSLLIDVRTSRDGGATWSTLASISAGVANGPPAVLVRSGRIDVMLMTKNSQPAFLTIDRKSGKASEPAVVDCVKRLGEGLWPELVEVKGALYLLAADLGVCVLLRSPDDGKTWSKVETPAWKQMQSDGVKAAFFACGGVLHVVTTPELDRIEHHASADEGKTWAKRATAFKAASKVISYGGASSGKNAVILYGAYEGTRREAALHALTSADGGETWSEGGKVMETGFSDPQLFRSISMAESRVLFLGVAAARKGQGAGVASLSADGGKTWKDLDLNAGLAKVNYLGTGALTKDGALAVFANTEDFNLEKGESTILARRWGTGLVLPALTEREREQLSTWIAELKDDDVGVRGKAADGICALGQRARPALAKAIDEARDAEVKAALQAVLKRLTPPWLKE